MITNVLTQESESGVRVNNITRRSLPVQRKAEERKAIIQGNVLLITRCVHGRRDVLVHRPSLQC